jgi:hypothetical protein
MLAFDTARFAVPIILTCDGTLLFDRLAAIGSSNRSLLAGEF